MSALLQSIVDQLKQLEKGVSFERRSNHTYVTPTLKVFLICAYMDKPASIVNTEFTRADSTIWMWTMGNPR
jgi:hypothetical protein